MRKTITQSLYLYPSLHPLIHQPIIHSLTPPSPILPTFYPSSNQSPTHYIFIPVCPLIHQPTNHLLIASSSILPYSHAAANLWPNYSHLYPSFHPLISQSFIHLLHFIHPSVLSSATNQLCTHCILSYPSNHSTISRPSSTHSHLHSHLHHLIHQPIAWPLSISSSILPSSLPWANHSPIHSLHLCSPLSSNS